MKYNISEILPNCLASSIDTVNQRIALVFKTDPKTARIFSFEKSEKSKASVDFDLDSISNLKFSDSGNLIAAVSE